MMRAFWSRGCFSVLGLLFCGVICRVAAGGETLGDDLKAKVDARVIEIRAWAADPIVVGAVRQRNGTTPKGSKA